jgi:hypothetical protein
MDRVTPARQQSIYNMPFNVNTLNGEGRERKMSHANTLDRDHPLYRDRTVSMPRNPKPYNATQRPRNQY